MLENGAIIKNTYFYIGRGIDFQQPHADTTIHNSNSRQATDFCECQTCIWYTYKQAKHSYTQNKKYLFPGVPINLALRRLRQKI